MSDALDMVTLHDSSKAARAMVAIVMESLELLLKEHPIPFYELAMISRDRSHVLFGNSEEKLKALYLLEGDGQPHGSVRDIVRNAVSGEGVNMYLRNPVKE